MSKYAAKRSGLSSDFLGAMIHALRLAEKQLSKSGSSSETRSVPVVDPKRSARGVRRERNLTSDKRVQKTCVKSSLGKGKSPKKDFSKRKPTSLKEHDAPKVSVAEKKALRRELSKKTGFQTTKDLRNKVGQSKPATRIVRDYPNQSKDIERTLDIKKKCRSYRRSGLRSCYSYLASKQGTTEVMVEKLDPADKKMLDKRRREAKAKVNASSHAILLPVTECGLLKRGASVYSHYTWTVDSKGSALKVKRDYGKAIDGLDLTKVGVKNSRVHCGYESGKIRKQVSSPAARAVAESEKKLAGLRWKIELSSYDPIETLVAKMSTLSRNEYKDVAYEGGVVYDDNDKARITRGTLKKGFAYGRRTMLRTAMFKAVRPIETSMNVPSTAKWTLLDKSEFSRLRNVAMWHSMYSPVFPGKARDWSGFARWRVRKDKTWREITDDLEKEVGPICEKYAKDGMKQDSYPRGYAVYDKNFDYLNG